MSLRKIRDKLKTSIETGDETLLNLLDAAVDAYQSQSKSGYNLNSAQKIELDRRSTLNEPTVNWDVAKKQIRGGEKK